MSEMYVFTYLVILKTIYIE